HLLDVTVDRGDLLVRKAGRGGDHAPVLDHDVEAAFLDGRRVDALDALTAGNGDQAQRAGLYLGLELAVAGNARRHLVAEDRGKRLAAAGIGDIVDLGRVDARRLGDEAGRDVVRAAGRAARPGDRAGIGLQRLDEVFHVLDRRGGRNDDRLVFTGKPRDGCHVLQGDQRLVGEDRADHHVAADDESVRIAGILAGELGKADR